MSYATSLELNCCITEIPMDNAVDMVELQSLRTVTLIMVILFAPSSGNLVYYIRPNTCTSVIYIHVFIIWTTNENQHGYFLV